MQAILLVTAPFFALVLCGWLAAHRHVLPESAIPGLNAFVLYFALPCMLFRFGAGTPVLELLDPVVLAVWLLCAALMVGFTIASTLDDQVRLDDAAFGALVAAFPNTGFMGVPLLVALLGPAAAGPAICTITADLVVTSTACLALAEAGRQAGRGLRQALPRILWGVAKNPMPWAIAAGAVLGHFRARGPGRGQGGEHAGRRRQPGGAVHHRRRAVAGRPPCAYAHAGQAIHSGGPAQAAAAPAARAVAAGQLAAERHRARRGTGQRVHPGRALWRGQRPHRAHHHGLDGAGLCHLHGHRLAVRRAPESL
jgi:hypothetical protein